MCHPRSLRRPVVRRTVSALAALALGAASVLFVAAPASAHDELVSTDPAAETTVDALPPELTLTFSGGLLDEPGATQVEVTDAAGTVLSPDDPTVAQTVVTQPLEGEASGVVTVRWRVVSSDGHPISGEYAFTVAPPPTPTPTTTAQPAPTTPAPTPTETTEPSPTASPVPAEEGSSAVPWIIGGVVVGAVVIAVAYLVISRKRRGR